MLVFIQNIRDRDGRNAEILKNGVINTSGGGGGSFGNDSVGFHAG